MPRPLPHDKPNTVLVPGNDHDFWLARLVTEKVIYDKRGYCYHEWFEDCPLDDDYEVVIEVQVAR